MKEILIRQISKIKVGHAQDVQGGTGCTVVICENGAVGGVDVRGGSAATRETELLDSLNSTEKIHAVMLSGGSAYGLDASCGAMEFLEEKGIGFDVQVGVVPLVCGASLFDLTVGDPRCRPDKAMGYAACVTAWEENENAFVAEGNVGAGTGASVGKFLGPKQMMKGGLGTYALAVGDLKVGVIVAVNALGDIIDIENGEQIAGLLNEEQTGFLNTEEALFARYDDLKNLFSGNTTIGVIVTNAKLTKAQAGKVSGIAHNGFARAIRPVHTTADGDTIFTMATGEVDAMVDAVGVLATKAMAKAINRAVYAAQSAYGLKAARDIKADMGEVSGKVI